MQKKNINKLIKQLKGPKKEVVESIYVSFEKKFKTLPGSIKKHQAWRGGYEDHIEEVMNIAELLYKSMSKVRKLEFSLDSALFVLFLHDYDKLERYKMSGRGKFSRKSEYKNLADHMQKVLREDYKYEIPEEEYNAIKYTHGEGSDYSPDKRVMEPLAAFVHSCDTISARIWHKYGRSSISWKQ